MSHSGLLGVRTGALVIAGLAVGLAGAAQAQLKPGSQKGLGLMGARVPPLLQQIRADPYRVPGDCQAIADELAQLDKIMGPDVDKPQIRHTIADKAAGYVRDAIPYHGVVRFLMGADAKDKKLQAAANAGYARRGFLRGLQAQQHCDGAAETRVADAAVPPAPAASAHAVETAARVPDRTPGLGVRIAADEARADAADARADADDARPNVAVARAEPPPPAAAPTPRRGHVVYQLVDATTGRPIVPDGPPSPDGGH